MIADESATLPPKRRHEWKAVQHPRRYSMPAAERMLGLIREGVSLREIGKRPGMPTLSTIDRWLGENHKFRALYESARQFRCEVLADDVATLAEAGSDDELAAKKFRFEVLKWDVDARSKAEKVDAARHRSSPKRLGV